MKSKRKILWAVMVLALLLIPASQITANCVMKNHVFCHECMNPSSIAGQGAQERIFQHAYFESLTIDLLFACYSEYSSTASFPQYFAEISAPSKDPCQVILRI